MLKEMLKGGIADDLLPEVQGARCLHALSTVSSCRRCVDACPVGAWRLDDDGLQLDTAVCDGCGLCVSACSEGALTHRYKPLLGWRQGQRVAFVACERAVNVDKEARVPCVHLFGERDLLRLRLQGVTQLTALPGECEACFRNGAQTLKKRLGEIAGHTRDGEATIAYVELDAASFGESIARSRQPDQSVKVDRRAFLRGAVRRVVEVGLESAGMLREEGARFRAEGELWGETGAGGVLPWVPVIAGRRCNGCDACLRLCPHGVLSVEGGASPRYRVDAARCTACGLCVDICPEDAIEVRRWAVPDGEGVSLAVKRCPSCGVGFHVPVEAGDEVSRCQVCRRVDHSARLYQVIE